MLFGLTNAFQNGMTQPSSTNDHRTTSLQGKGLGAGQSLPGGVWAGVLPTQTLLETNFATPESFNQIGSPIQMLIHILISTAKPNDKHNDLMTILQCGTQIKNLKFNFRWVLFIQN